MKYQADFTDFALLSLLHKDVDESHRGHSGVYVNYESGDWNYRQFMVWIQKHIPEYALTYSELQTITPQNLFTLATKAARLIHDRDTSIEKKGEIGEIILHGLIRDIYKTEPLVSKIYYKSHPSENVKGFDCVHVTINETTGDIESLWLGEAKFHTDVAGAIGSAFRSVSGFLEAKKMQKEFLTVRNHLDDQNPIKRNAERLLSEMTSLDEIRSKMCVPVLIAYESNAVKKHTTLSAEFTADIEAEIQKNVDDFLSKFTFAEDLDVDIHVFFLPLRDKVRALETFREHISGYQGAPSLY